MTSLESPGDEREQAGITVRCPAETQPHSPRIDHLPDPCTSAELAAALRKSSKTIVDWCQERAYTHIPCFRLGNRWYHRVPELIRWLNSFKNRQTEFRRRPRPASQRP